MFIGMGHLARDADLRYTTSGKAVFDNSIAMNRKWTTEDGEKKEEVTFLDFAAFGRTAETMGEYFKKGSLVHLTGYLKTESWEDKQTGAKRNKLKLIVERFAFCGSSGKESEPSAKPSQAAYPGRTFAKSKAKEPAEATSNESDDVPF